VDSKRGQFYVHYFDTNQGYYWGTVDLETAKLTNYTFFNAYLPSPTISLNSLQLLVYSIEVDIQPPHEFFFSELTPANGNVTRLANFGDNYVDLIPNMGTIDPEANLYFAILKDDKQAQYLCGISLTNGKIFYNPLLDSNSTVWQFFGAYERN